MSKTKGRKNNEACLANFSARSSKHGTHWRWTVTAVPSHAKAPRYPVHFPSIILWSRWKHGIIFGGGMEKTTADYGQHSFPLASPSQLCLGCRCPAKPRLEFLIATSTHVCVFSLSLHPVKGNSWLLDPREECVTITFYSCNNKASPN